MECSHNASALYWKNDLKNFQAPNEIQIHDRSALPTELSAEPLIFAGTAVTKYLSP